MAGASGLGTVLLFTDSTWTASPLTISFNGRSCPVDDITPLNTAVKAGLQSRYRTNVSTKLADPGQLQVSCVFDPTDPPPYDAPPELIRLTFHNIGALGVGTAGKFENTGFISAWDLTVNENAPRMNITIKLTGNPSFTTYAGP